MTSWTIPGTARWKGLRRLAGLEEDVGVLGRAADDRGVRRQAARAEGEHVVVADQRADVVVVEHARSC